MGSLNQPRGLQLWGPLALVATLIALVLFGTVDPYRWGVQARITALFEPLRASDPKLAEDPVIQSMESSVTPATSESKAEESVPQSGAIAHPDELEPPLAKAPQPFLSPDTMPKAIMPDGTPPPPAMDDAKGQNITGMSDGGAPLFEADEKLDVAKTENSLVGDLIKAGTPDRAFVHLFKLWNNDYLKLAGLTPCDKAQAAELRCSQGKTDVSGLKTMNRPVVASFVMPGGERLYGVISAIENDLVGETITIDFGDRAVSMRTPTYGLRWPGDYLVVWKQGEIIPHSLAFGQLGEDVVELRRLLAKAGYGDGDNDLKGQGDVLFGPTLRDKLRLFQQDHGLDPDGVAGPKTLMRITGVVGETFGPSIFERGD